MNRSISEVNNSERVEARNRFRKSGKVIQVHVENEDDIPFWKGIFIFYQLKVIIYPATKSNKRLERGKSTVLKMAEQTGNFLLLCV